MAGKRTALLIAALAIPAGAQTQVDLRTQSKNIDFSAASSTRPLKMGTELPASCSPGELFFKANEIAGRNLYGCTEANRWTWLGGPVQTSGCGLVGCEAGQCAVDAAAIPSYEGPLAVHGVVVARESSVVRAIPGGPAGYLLASGGSSADPSWVPAPSGGGTANPAGAMNTVQINGGSGWSAVPLNSSSSRKFLMQVSGGAPAFDALQASDVPVSPGGSTPAGAVNTVQINGGTGLAAVPLNGGSARKFLMQVSGNSPAFDVLQASDVPVSPGGSTPAGAMNTVQINGGTGLAAVPLNSDSARKFLVQASGGAPVFEALQAADVPPRVVASYPAIAAAKCQSGVAAANFNLPPANAPTARCQAGATYGAYLEFAANTTQAFLEHWQLPADWPGTSSAIDLELAGRSSDAAHPVSVAVQYACVGAGGFDDLALAAAGNAVFTPPAASGRGIAAVGGLASAGCHANDEYYAVVSITTDAAATAGYHLFTIRPVVRRTF